MLKLLNSKMLNILWRNNYEENEIQEPQASAKLNEDEIKQRVGEQNLK